MPIPTLITDLSQTAGSNYPAGSDSPSVLDDVQRAHAGFIAQLRDGKGQSTPLTLASATTTDIGGQNSQFVEISGTTTITSLGTNYTGVRYLRFTGILTLTFNSTTININGGVSVTTAVGDTAIAIPNSSLTGWNVYYVRNASSVGGGDYLNTLRADIASAGTVDLTAGASATRNINITGTTTITAFTVASGQTYFVRFNASLTLTNNGSIVTQSGASIVTQAGDTCIIRSTAANVVEVLSYVPASGTPQLSSITATVASNALTITLNPQAVTFRSTTLTTGVPTTANVTAPITVVVPSSATLGTTNAILSRLAVIAINNAGTVELAVVNTLGGNDLSETGLISTTAISTSATSASVFYSTTARTSVAYRVVGFVESTQATAGTWATTPSLVQGSGGNVVLSKMNYIMSATQNTTSGTSIDFTSIPNWAKRITVMFNGVSTNGTSSVRIQIGGGSVETSGYLGSSSAINGAGGASCATFTSGFDLADVGSAASLRSGSVFLSFLGSNIWTLNGIIANSDVSRTMHIAGSKTTSSSLDRIRLTAVNGTDTFDAGSASILIEG